MVDEPLDVLVNGKLIARAEIVPKTAVSRMRIVELANAKAPIGAAA